MWSPLSLLKPLSDSFKSWNDGRVKLKEANIAVKMAERQNRARLLQSESDHNSEWEMAQIVDKDKWLRRISFAMFSAPFIWALFDPEGVREYFETALASMPEWYVKIFVGMTGAIWGISHLKNGLPAILGGIKKALK
jgi:hypothetical protein